MFTNIIFLSVYKIIKQKIENETSGIFLASFTTKKLKLPISKKKAKK